jgi:hypothetical protein
MLFCFLHRPMDAETHSILSGERSRKAERRNSSGDQVVGRRKPAHHQEYRSGIPGGCIRYLEKKRKRKDSASSDDTASVIKGGGYIGARTRQPPNRATIKKKLMWVRGVVCRSTQTQSLTVVACVILQCISCFYECRCMSDGNTL